jgi:CHAD domain-containing protein
VPPEQVEYEYTFRPTADAVLPDLSVLPGVQSVDPWQDFDLVAVYFDTPQLSLARSGVTLRRRSGGADDGWHLKVPTVDGNGRTEISTPLGRTVRTPPKQLRMAALPWTRDDSLGVVATVRTSRRSQRLRAADGSTLAEVCDDVVHGQSQLMDHPQHHTWREWELELGNGTPALVGQAHDLLQETAGEPVTGGSKLARTLGEAMPQVDQDWQRELTSSTPSRVVVARRLSEQVAALKIHDSEVRRDAPDGVHQTRVTIRRLRSALATFRPLLDRSVTEPLRDELQWIGRVLSDARDAEVIRIRLIGTLEREPAELVLGRVRRRIDGDLKRAYKDARARALDAMESPRYLRLLNGLDELLAAAPWTDVAEEASSDVLPRRVRREWKRFRRRVKAAHDADEPAVDLRLHEARKAAKRVRYAAETLQPIYEKDAKRLARKVKKVQSTLGDNQDSVVARRVLRKLAVQAHLDGDNAFTFGRLHGLEQAAGKSSVERFEKAWKRAKRPRVRAWLG